MKRFVLCLFVVVPLLLVLSGGVARALGLDFPNLHPKVVATFTPGQTQFPESLAVSQQGNLFVSLTDWATAPGVSNIGQVWKITPSGVKTRFGTSIGVTPGGLVTGLAFDGSGRLFLADATFATSPKPGVLALKRDGSWQRVLYLPASSFPNGLAIHDGQLYVSDSTLGAIWRVTLGKYLVVPKAPWLRSALLKPRTSSSIGANGIAFWKGDLYVVVADSGRLVRIPLRNGVAGRPVLLTQGKLLVEADGMCFDANGGLWVVTNLNRLLRLTTTGRATLLGDQPYWLNYPTQPAFGTTLATRTTLYVENGAYWGATPDVVRLLVGVRGAPLP